MSRGRYQQQQWDQRAEAILAALATLVQARSFASVTMDELAEAVGISKATLYQHFASKDALLAALMQQHTARFLAWLERTADQPPIARLRATLRALIDAHYVSAPGAPPAAMPGPPGALLLIGREDVLPVFERTPALIALHEEVLARLAAIVREGQALGQIAGEIAPQVIVSALWALSAVPPAIGAPALARAPLDALGREAVIAQVLALFERAIAGPAPA